MTNIKLFVDIPNTKVDTYSLVPESQIYLKAAIDDLLIHYSPTLLKFFIRQLMHK